MKTTNIVMGWGWGGEDDFCISYILFCKIYGNSNILCQWLYLQKNEHICYPAGEICLNFQCPPLASLLASESSFGPFFPNLGQFRFFSKNRAPSALYTYGSGLCVTKQKNRMSQFWNTTVKNGWMNELTDERTKVNL